MDRKWTTLLVSSVLAAAGSAPALAQTYRPADDYTLRIGRAPDWNLAAGEGVCRLRVWVDDRAQVQLRGDQIIVRTQSGERSFDQGSLCNQPLPLRRVEDFRITAERGRGAVHDVQPPLRRNGFTSSFHISDPQNGGDSYELVVAWNNRDMPPAPVAAADPFPFFDETRACQERVRADFLARNRDDAYVEFASVPMRDELGPDRERIRGEAWARNRFETRPISYECVLNERSNRVLFSAYELGAPRRYSALQ